MSIVGDGVRRPDVVGMRWAAFKRHFDEHWSQGQHVALVGPTGEGKSTMATQLLGLRRWVMALDPKGGDSTLAATGFPRISQWDRRTRHDIERAIDQGHAVRRIVGPVVERRSDFVKTRRVCKDVLEYVFEVGGWTTYVDELQIAADRRMMNLAGDIETLLIAARDKGVSVVSSFQAPRWVPRAASDQSTWIVVFYTKDTDVVNRLAEMTGRPKAEIRGAVDALDKHFCLVFHRNPRQPIIVTRARAMPAGDRY